VKICNKLDQTSYPTKYWKRLNELTGKCSRTPYPLIEQDQPLHNDQDKADAFANYLQDIFTSLLPDRPEHNHPVIDSTLPPSPSTQCKPYTLPT